jgi:hypothetical protein
MGDIYIHEPTPGPDANTNYLAVLRVARDTVSTDLTDPTHRHRENNTVTEIGVICDILGLDLQGALEYEQHLTKQSQDTKHNIAVRMFLAAPDTPFNDHLERISEPPPHNLLLTHTHHYLDERDCHPECPFRVWEHTFRPRTEVAS